MLKWDKRSLTTLEAFKPGSTDSKRKLGASLSSSFTKHRYASTGVKWSENMGLNSGIKFPCLAASLNLTEWSTAAIIIQKLKKTKEEITWHSPPFLNQNSLLNSKKEFCINTKLLITFLIFHGISGYKQDHKLKKVAWEYSYKVAANTIFHLKKSHICIHGKTKQKKQNIYVPQATSF